MSNSDRVTVQNLLDLAERGRQTTERMAEAQLVTATAMEKLAGEVKKLDSGERKTFLRLIVFLVGVVCLFGGLNVWQAMSDPSAAALIPDARVIFTALPSTMPPPPPP